MSEIRIENARITSTMLGIEDHGILTAQVTVEGHGWGVSFGGYALDSYVKSRDLRIGTAYGLTFVMRVMETVGVSKWESLKGQFVRVKSDGLGRPCIAIGHLIEDKWFDPKTDELLKSLAGGAA